MDDPHSSLRYLIVEDDPLVARSIARVLPETAHVEIAGEIATARRMARDGLRWDGLIVDVGLPDGSGLDLLAEMRDQGFHGPALVLTGQRDDRTLITAQLHRALFLPKPPRPPNLQSFVRWTEEHQSLVRRRVQGEIDVLDESIRLTPRERQILELGCYGVPRGEIAARLGVEETTAKSLVRRLIRKTRHQSLGDLVAEIHRHVFLED